VNDFLVPCGLLLGTVFVSFLLMCWFFHATYIKDLRHRVQRLEHLVAPPRRNTEDVVPVRTSTPRPNIPRKYITVDRQPRFEHD